MGKRLVFVVLAVAMLSGGYAAGAATGSGVVKLRATTPRGLWAATEANQQTVTMPDSGPPVAIPFAHLTVKVNDGDQGVFDIRFSANQESSSTSPGDVHADVLVDGTPVAPSGWPEYTDAQKSFAMERVTGPLAPGRHVVSVEVSLDAHATGGPFTTTLNGWTLVVQQVTN